MSAPRLNPRIAVPNALYSAVRRALYVAGYLKECSRVPELPKFCSESPYSVEMKYLKATVFAVCWDGKDHVAFGSQVPPRAYLCSFNNVTEAKDAFVKALRVVKRTAYAFLTGEDVTITDEMFASDIVIRMVVEGWLRREVANVIRKINEIEKELEL